MTKEEILRQFREEFKLIPLEQRDHSDNYQPQVNASLPPTTSSPRRATPIRFGSDPHNYQFDLDMGTCKWI